MIISTGSKEHLFSVNCPDTIIIFENVSLLFVAGFVIFDSLLRSPSSSPPLVSMPHIWHVQNTSIRGSLLEALDIRGTCSRAIINRGRGYTEYRFLLLKCQGSSGQRSVTDNVSAIWDILRMCLWDKRFSWLEKE